MNITFSDHVTENFEAAIQIIDGKFGKGYAKKHPELISGFMQAAALDILTTELGEQLSKLRD